MRPSFYLIPATIIPLLHIISFWSDDISVIQILLPHKGAFNMAAPPFLTSKSCILRVPSLFRASITPPPGRGIQCQLSSVRSHQGHSVFYGGEMTITTETVASLSKPVLLLLPGSLSLASWSHGKFLMFRIRFPIIVTGGCLRCGVQQYPSILQQIMTGNAE
jgi:hypothetical protein